MVIMPIAIIQHVNNELHIVLGWHFHEPYRLYCLANYLGSLPEIEYDEIMAKACLVEERERWTWLLAVYENAVGKEAGYAGAD